MFWTLDACAQAGLVRNGDVTPPELVEAAIARIEALDPRLNALVTPRFDRALDEARGDLTPGPFRGVPILVKDYLCETAGDPCFEGSAFLRNLGWRSRVDSPLASRFREAGFVILGRTNVPEFAGSATTEPIAFGPTRNPWNPERSAGGSSGGSAAAVAAGMVPVAHANDGTGSIRIPAACCGLVGLRPSGTPATVEDPATPGVPEYVVEHVVTRTVRDAAAVLDAIRGSGGKARSAPPRPFRGEGGASAGRLRIGFLGHDPLLRNCRDIRPGIRDSDPASRRAVEETAHLLESLGHDVEEAWPESLRGPTGLGGPRGIIAASELAARIDSWIERTGRAPRADELEPATLAMLTEGRRHSTAEVEDARRRLVEGVRPIREWWARGFDLLLTPTTNGSPPRIGAFSELPIEEEGWRLAEAFGLYTVPYGFTGQPAVSLPAGWDHGMPIGIQLVADRGRDDLLLRIASELERARPWADRWPSID